MDLRNGFDIKRYIRTIPDYPKPGIMFRDITTLLADLHAFRASVDELAWPFLRGNIDYVAGIEARGFILGGAVAATLGRGFIPIRKKGKLPSRTIGQEYALEYGVDTIEIHADAIAKGDRVCRANRLAGRHDFAVTDCSSIFFRFDPGRRDSLRTICAFLHHAAASDRNFWIAHQLILRRIPILIKQKIESANFVRTVI